MVDISLPHRHVREHDLHNALTSSHCHRSTHVHHSVMLSQDDDTAVTSVLHAGANALPVGPLFGGDYTPPSNNFFDTEIGRGGGSAPADGDYVWFCSQCGDGPIGSWQAVCVSCDHHKCSSCTAEKI